MPAGLPAYEGEVIAVMATSNGQYPSPTTRNPAMPTASIDGLTIQGGTQSDFGGAPAVPGVPALITQGGGIYVQGSAHYLPITNNLIHSNSGSYGGGIRVGTPEISSGNDHVRIAYNRLYSNSGTNLAGGIGLFAGSSSYRVDHNDLCGNFSAEYGGAISHYGLSDRPGQIDHNRIYFNRSYDEGGAVMVAGELPAVATG